MKRIEILRWDVFENCERWLSCFDTPTTPRIGLGASQETVWIRNFPLPDKYQPDHVDLVLIVNTYPVDPPKGIYLLSCATSRALVASLRQRFNVFQDQAFHDAPAIANYEWICFGYLRGWRFRASAPHKGDNLGKLLRNFWHALEE